MYDSVHYLQNEVVFGQVSDPAFIWWKSIPLGMVISLAFMAIKLRISRQRAFRR